MVAGEGRIGQIALPTGISVAPRPGRPKNFTETSEKGFTECPNRCLMRAMEETAFDTIVATHHGEIFRYLRRIAWRGGLADDLAHLDLVAGLASMHDDA